MISFSSNFIISHSSVNQKAILHLINKLEKIQVLNYNPIIIPNPNLLIHKSN